MLICRDGNRAAVQVIIVEIQRGQDPGKVRSCHVYQAVYWAVLGGTGLPGSPGDGLQ